MSERAGEARERASLRFTDDDPNVYIVVPVEGGVAPIALPVEVLYDSAFNIGEYVLREVERRELKVRVEEQDA